MPQRGPKTKSLVSLPTGQTDSAARTRLVALASQLGNDAMAGRIAQGKANQQDMMAFVTARLQRVAEIQLREVELTRKDGAHYRSWRAIGDRMKAEIKEAEPTRWGEVAVAYERALVAVSRGDLHRAKQLVIQARAVEGRVGKDTTDLVQTDDVVERSPDPDWLAEAVLLSSTSPSDVPPKTRQLVQSIVDVTYDQPTMRGMPKVRRPWWAEEEDDDEEHEEDG